MKTDSIGKVLDAGDAEALLRVIVQLPEPPPQRYSSQVSVQLASARRAQGKLVGPNWWKIQEELGLP